MLSAADVRVTVMDTFCDLPGLMVNVAGDTATVRPARPVTDTEYVLRRSTFVSVRVTVCEPARSPIAIDGPLKSLGSSTGMPALVQFTAGSCVPHRKPSQSFQPESNTRPGSVALFGATWPAPWLKITAGLVPGPSSTSYDVVISADLIIIGDQRGYRSLNRAAMPAMCGDDIEVPLSRLKLKPPSAGEYAARMSWPGAMMSGFSRSPPPASSGPRDENDAVYGAGVL